MATAITVQVSTAAQLRIGLIVRYKLGPDHTPGRLDSHADCILSDGSPLGFFGERNDGSGNGSGMGMQGSVYDYDVMLKKRLSYVNMEKAIEFRVVSTVLLINVSSEAAKLFADAWTAMKSQPGNFNILGGNCASHASAAFISAKVVGKQIPGLDTPDNLYRQLAKALGRDGCSSITGHLGFRRSAQGGYVMNVTPYKAAATVNTPKGSSSWGNG